MSIVKNLFLLLGLFFILTSPSSARETPADVPSGAVYDVAPFNMEPKYFTSRSCPNLFNCQDPRITSYDLAAMAGECAAKRYGFDPAIITSFEYGGPYANCAIPGSYAPKGERMGANAQWPICCLTEQNGLCGFNCHFFLTNKFQPE